MLQDYLSTVQNVLQYSSFVSALSQWLLISIDTASIILTQCKSAAESVMNQVGMPNIYNIVYNSYTSCCQYAGDTYTFFRNLYACSLL